LGDLAENNVKRGLRSCLRRVESPKGLYGN